MSSKPIKSWHDSTNADKYHEFGSTHTLYREAATRLAELASIQNGESVLVMSKSAEDSLDENQRNTITNHSRIISCDINTIEVCGGGSTRCMMAEIFLPKK